MTDYRTIAGQILRGAYDPTQLGEDPKLTNELLAGILAGILGLHDLLAGALAEDDLAETVERPTIPRQEPADRVRLPYVPAGHSEG